MFTHVVVCYSTEDKSGEIGIIIALAMLILGTFQWCVVTSIAVDGMVCAPPLLLTHISTHTQTHIYAFILVTLLILAIPLCKVAP